MAEKRTEYTPAGADDGPDWKAEESQHAQSSPGHQETTLGQAGTSPRRSGNTPANGHEPPGQANTSPGKSGDTPGKSRDKGDDGAHSEKKSNKGGHQGR